MVRALSPRWLALLSLVLGLELLGAPPARAQCASAGAWAVRLELPVTWRANTALKGGTGHMVYTALVERTPGSAPGRVEERLTVCSFEQPATQTMRLWGGERFAVTYDEASLAAEPITLAAFFADADRAAREAAGEPAQAVGAEDDELGDYEAGPVALEVGVRLPGGARAAWPQSVEAFGGALLGGAAQPGALACSREDGDFVLPPIDYARSRRASRFFVASRAVVSLRATFAGCDAMLGAARIEDVEGRPGLDGTLVGCETTDGGTCSPGDLSLTNLFQPAWRPRGEGRYAAVRLGAHARCADVHAANFPVPPAE